MAPVPDQSTDRRPNCQILLVSWTYPDMIFNLIFNIFFLLVPPGVIFSIKRQERKIGELTVEEASLLAGK